MEQTPIAEEIDLVTRPAKSTQFFIFNLFGDYILPKGGRIWTNDLLYLLDLLDVNEGAARTTLSRMKQQGWFETEKDGRQSQYIISKRGQRILEEGDKRIFEGPFTDWNGRWHMIIYSLPEDQRRERNELRKKLTWFGFGNLAPGTWISAHNWQDEILAFTDELGISEYVNSFSSLADNNQNIVQKCWPLDSLSADYNLFLERHQPEFEAYQSKQQQLSPEACFIRRFWLTYNFQRFPLKDPNLPVDLLPADWPGTTARKLFKAYRAQLSSGMGDLIDKVIQGDR